MTAQSTLSSMTFTRSLARQSFLVQGVAVLIGSAFIAAAAQITVPMIPVPMTMQTFAVLLVGALFGARLGAATLVAYLLEGAAGLPVWAGAGNLASLMAKPASAGYLIGFLAAAWLVGYLVERGYARNLLGSFAVFLAGNVVIYLFGVPFLAALTDWSIALYYGLAVFVLGDALKLVLAALIREGVGRIAIGKGE